MLVIFGQVFHIILGSNQINLFAMGHFNKLSMFLFAQDGFIVGSDK